MYPSKAKIDIPTSPVKVIPWDTRPVSVPRPFEESDIEPVSGFFKEQIRNGRSPKDSLEPNGVQPFSGEVLTGADTVAKGS